MARFVKGSTAAALAIALLAPFGSFANGYKVPDLSGTWNVTAKPTGFGNCTNDGKTSVYQWLLAGDGLEVSVTVLGETVFPKLQGTLSTPENMVSKEQAGAGAKSLGEGWACPQGQTCTFKIALTGTTKPASTYTKNPALTSTSLFRLELNEAGTEFKGTRYYAGANSVMDDRPFGKVEVGKTACIAEFDVVGKKQ